MNPATSSPPPPPTDPPTFLAVLRVYLRLGCTCFGGPLAHFGIFRAEFVTRRRWLDDAAFAHLLALSQILPGPSSSQLGFLIGWQRARLRGACAAWLGFTLPSLVLLIAAAILWRRLALPAADAALHGVALAVLAIVAQAVRGMATTLCNAWRPAAIALVAAGAALALPPAWAQPAALALAGLAGWALLRRPATTANPVEAVAIALPGPRLTATCFALVVLAALATALATACSHDPTVRATAACFRAGALVFGGGHVMLPLLQPVLVGGGLMDARQFLAGYGLTQLMPGPLFAFGGFVGASAGAPPPGLAMLAGLACGVAIFLPGLLLALGALRLYGALRAHPAAAAAMAGLAAGSVGVLGAACVSPLGVGAIHGWADAALAALALAALTLRAPPWAVVIGLGTLTALLG
jgi:chromate transporter